MTCESAYEMWTALQRVHEKKDPTSKLAASQAFHDYRYETGIEMSKHIANVKNLARRCKDLNDELSETSVMAKLLQGLPAKYRSVATIWCNKSEKDQHLHELCAMLEHEEAAQDADDLATAKMEALNVKQDNKKKTQHKKTLKSIQKKKDRFVVLIVTGLVMWRLSARKNRFVVLIVTGLVMWRLSARVIKERTPRNRNQRNRVV
ncbi:hypothetical protein X777_11268 [Ooceraea biroi]|uniref:Copia protein n=1 Tax=Ooceraea biroi TaxID=2015173 RepID=A0A026W2L2_OOCBI|nr:hypothetical protein X777_11268 [Ooceraea biroi]